MGKERKGSRERKKRGMEGNGVYCVPLLNYSLLSFLHISCYFWIVLFLYIFFEGGIENTVLG